jgi:hypothetical protein
MDSNYWYQANMPTPRFSIGIDLGTTNCALAFVPLDGEAKSEIFGIPQWGRWTNLSSRLI